MKRRTTLECLNPPNENWTNHILYRVHIWLSPAGFRLKAWTRIGNVTHSIRKLLTNQEREVIMRSIMTDGIDCVAFDIKTGREYISYDVLREVFGLA